MKIDNRVLAAALAAAAVCQPAGVRAQPAKVERSFIFRPPDDQVPNVPDRSGCVRACAQDAGPCDPPIYKRADGRCTRDY